MVASAPYPVGDCYNKERHHTNKYAAFKRHDNREDGTLGRRQLLWEGENGEGIAGSKYHTPGI